MVLSQLNIFTADGIDTLKVRALKIMFIRATGPR